MKRGDKVPVHIGGHQVAMAEVKELEDGTATLVVPATLVVMGVRTELTDLPTTEPSTETIITGVDRPAPVDDTIPSDTSLSSEPVAQTVEPAQAVPSATPPVNNEALVADNAPTPAEVPAPAPQTVAEGTVNNPAPGVTDE